MCVTDYVGGDEAIPGYERETSGGRFDIGEGGFGLVFGAREVATGVWRALKILPVCQAGHADIEIAGIRQLLRLVDQSRGLDDYFVRIHHVDANDPARGFHYCLMELAENAYGARPQPGEDFRSRYEALSLEWHIDQLTQVPARDVLRLGRRLLEGLSIVHGYHCAHFDIKPSNVLAIDRGGSDGEFASRWRIADVGLMGFRSERGSTGTNGQGRSGTQGYFHPDLSPNDPRNDLYAVGMTMYRVYAKWDHAQLPHFVAEGLYQRDLDEPALRRVLARACHENVNELYRSAEEMIADLDRACASYRASNSTGLGGPIRPPREIAIDVRLRVRFNTGRLPQPYNEVVRRKDYLDTLDRYWEQGGGIVALLADGGSGKTTLAAAWLRALEDAGHYDDDPARRVAQAMDWTFYRPVGETPLQSAKEYFEELCGHFGIPTNADPMQMAREAAAAFRRVGGLLVIDGLEVLLLPPSREAGSGRGRVKDDALAEFLQLVAVHERPGPGVPRRMVLLTSRWPLTNERIRYQRAPVRPLTVAEGAELLRRYAVPGTNPEQLAEDRPGITFEAVAERYGLHPLSLSLLASYLIRFHGGRLSAEAELRALKADSDGEAAGRHAQRVMEGYERMLSGPEKQVILLLGLFDHNAPLDVIKELCRQKIPKLTDELVHPKTLAQAIADVRMLGLVYPERSDQRELESHPIIRQYAGRVLAERLADQARIAHAALFRIYLRRCPTEDPTTIQEARRMIVAIGHGIRGGAVAEAVGLLFQRLMRGESQYLVSRLQGFSEAIGLLAQFFVPGVALGDNWRQPIPGLTPEKELELRTLAGSVLIALKGLSADEVRQVYLHGEDLGERVGTLPQRAEIASGLWRYYVTRGQLQDAEIRSDRLRTLSERDPADCNLQIAADIRVGATHFWRGRFREAWATLTHGRELCARRGYQRFKADAIEDPLVLFNSNLATTGFMLGRLGEGAECARQAREYALEKEQPYGYAFALNYSGWFYVNLKQFDMVAQLAQKLSDEAEKHGFASWQATARMLKGLAEAWNGPDPQFGLERFHVGLAAWKSVSRLVVPYFQAVAAQVILGHPQSVEYRTGRHRSLLEDSLDTIRQTGEEYYKAEVLRLLAACRREEGADPSDVLAQLDKADEVAGDMRQGAKTIQLRIACDRLRIAKPAALAQLTEESAKEAVRALLASLQDEPLVPDIVEAQLLCAS